MTQINLEFSAQQNVSNPAAAGLEQSTSTSS